MRQEDWRDREAYRLRRLRDHDEGPRNDYGQADYSELYRYDPETRSGYRAYDDGRRPSGRSFEGEDRSGDWDEARHMRRRRGPSDRVLWAVIVERLEDDRRLDLRDVDISVRDGEVTLDGLVRHKGDKRRIEDIADIEGVRHVQNNLRVRERGRWLLF